jgi:hypothetical protein
MLPHDLAVSRQCMAAIEMAWRPVGFQSRLVFGAPDVDCLVRRGGERPQQFHEVRAALDAAEAPLHLAPPARPDLHSLELGEGRRDRAGFRQAS